MADPQAQEAEARERSQRHFTEKAAEYDARPLIRELCGAAAKALKDGVLQPGMEVLDLGCGTGLLAAAIADSVGLVVGVDSSEGMIQAFQSKIDAQPGCNLRAVCADLVDAGSLHSANDPAQPFPEQFDLVVSSMTFHHIKDIPGVLRMLVSHLKPGGRVAVFDLKKDSHSLRFHGPDPAHTVHHRGGFTKEELCGYLTGVGLEGASCREVHTFKKPAGDDSSVELEFELLMALGTRSALGMRSST